MPPREERPFTPELAKKLEGRRVRVHRNLQNGLWSLTDNGKVVAHAESLRLSSVEFVVQPGGRDRAKAEHQRNVHAWAEGILTSRVTDYTDTIITYNPFLDKGFHTIYYEPIYQATALKFCPGGVCMGGNLNQLLLF
jgi:hypothetical protein